jgi:hypothetical protein
VSPTTASRLVIVCAALEAGFVLINGRKYGADRTFRALWAIGAVTLGLAVLADFVPQVAGPFALLVMLAMAVRSKGELGQFFSNPQGVTQ